MTESQKEMAAALGKMFGDQLAKRDRRIDALESRLQMLGNIVGAHAKQIEITPPESKPRIRVVGG